MIKRPLRLVALVLLSSLLMLGLVSPVSIADETGNSTTQQLAGSGLARWVLFIAPSGNGAAIRIGGSTTSATSGASIAPGGGLLLPPIPIDAQQTVLQNNYYDLSQIYFYATTGDTFSVMYAQ